LLQVACHTLVSPTDLDLAPLVPKMQRAILPTACQAAPAFLAC
jgi:hypothetical protein